MEHRNSHPNALALDDVVVDVTVGPSITKSKIKKDQI